LLPMYRRSVVCDWQPTERRSGVINKTVDNLWNTNREFVAYCYKIRKKITNFTIFKKIL